MSYELETEDAIGLKVTADVFCTLFYDAFSVTSLRGVHDRMTSE
jgi:hypothetical protein